MTVYKVQRSVQGTNGTTRDEYVNTFFIDTGTNVLTANAPDGHPWSKAIATTLDGLWLNLDSGGSRVLEYMSRRYQGPSVTKFYENLAISGAPVAVVDDGVAFAPPDNPSLPEECAVCLSYNVVPAGVIPARARGRIYIGPLSTSAMDDVTSNDQPVHVNPAFMNTLLLAGMGVQASLQAAGMDWWIYSRVNGTGAPITNWSVDDAFDTIRGRGTAPSVRISS